MRNKLVLPLPFGPVSWTKVPGDTAKSSPLKSLRSPRTHPSLLSSNIAGHPPASLYLSFAGKAFSQKKAQKSQKSSASWFLIDRAVHFQPSLPPALQHSHAFEAARLQDLRCGNARFVVWAGAVGDELAIFRKIFQRRKGKPRL